MVRILARTMGSVMMGLVKIGFKHWQAYDAFGDHGP